MYIIQIVRNFNSFTVLEGSNLTLFCQLEEESNSESSQIIWFRHLPDIQDHRPKVTGVPSAAEDPEKMILSNVQVSDTGWYSCKVRNNHGGIIRSGWIQVVPKELK